MVDRHPINPDPSDDNNAVTLSLSQEEHEAYQKTCARLDAEMVSTMGLSARMVKAMGLKLRTPQRDNAKRLREDGSRTSKRCRRNKDMLQPSTITTRKKICLANNQQPRMDFMDDLFSETV